MDKIKGMLHGHKKEGEEGQHTTGTGAGTGVGEPGYGQTTAAQTEGTGEKKHGLFGHRKEGEQQGEKKHGFMGMGGHTSSSSSSDEEREGARERNRIRRERRAQRKAGTAGAGVPGAGVAGAGVGDTTATMEGTGEKKHGFFG